MHAMCMQCACKRFLLDSSDITVICGLSFYNGDKRWKSSIAISSFVAFMLDYCSYLNWIAHTGNFVFSKIWYWCNMRMLIILNTFFFINIWAWQFLLYRHIPQLNFFFFFSFFTFQITLSVLLGSYYFINLIPRY